MFAFTLLLFAYPPPQVSPALHDGPPQVSAALAGCNCGDSCDCVTVLGACTCGGRFAAVTSRGGSALPPQTSREVYRPDPPKGSGWKWDHERGHYWREYVESRPTEMAVAAPPTMGTVCIDGVCYPASMSAPTMTYGSAYPAMQTPTFRTGLFRGGLLRGGLFRGRSSGGSCASGSCGG